MLGYLKRLVVSGAAYQFGDILAKGLALLTLPLYTRHVSPRGLRGRGNAADRGDPREHPAARRGGGGVHPLLLRRRRRGAPRPHRAHGHGHGGLDDDRRLAGRGGLRRPALASAARLPRPAADRLRDPRAVGVHEPRDGLRPAAGRRTPAHLPLRLGRQRAAERELHRRAGRVRGPGRPRAAAGELRRLGA